MRHFVVFHQNRSRRSTYKRQMNFFDPMKFKTPKLGIFVELIFKNKVMKCIIGFVLKFYAQIVPNRSRKI